MDMQHFKEQKDRDLREALVNFAVMQISMCKKVRSSTRQQQPTPCFKIHSVFFVPAGNSSVGQRQRVFPQNVKSATLKEVLQSAEEQSGDIYLSGFYDFI